MHNTVAVGAEALQVLKFGSAIRTHFRHLRLHVMRLNACLTMIAPVTANPIQAAFADWSVVLPIQNASLGRY